MITNLFYFNLFKIVLELLKQLQSVELELSNSIDDSNSSIKPTHINTSTSLKRSIHQSHLTPSNQIKQPYTSSTTLGEEEVLRFIEKVNCMYQKDYCMKKLSFNNVIRIAQLDEKDKPALLASAHFALWSQEPVIDSEFIHRFKLKVQLFCNKYGILFKKEKETS